MTRHFPSRVDQIVLCAALAAAGDLAMDAVAAHPLEMTIDSPPYSTGTVLRDRDGPAVDACLTLHATQSRGSAQPTVAPRVRDNGDPAVASLLRDAQEHSDTFRRLLVTIGATDGLVYVEQGKCRPGVHACLLMTVTVSGPNRILKVHVDIARDRADIIGSLGHELQHAIEVLKERGIRTDWQMYHFFDRLVGSPAARLGQLEFETEEAVRTGLKVRAEFIASTRSR